MPTGYTCDIPKGIDFKTYAMNCARAFDALVSLRDEPFGGDKIPDTFEPNDYHLKEAEKLRNELDGLEGATHDELLAAFAEDWDEQERFRTERLEAVANQRATYEAMLEKVKAWTPPTQDHVKLKVFMQDQIEQSIGFDCDPEYHDSPTPKPCCEDWAATRIRRLRERRQYHEEKYEEEKKRAARNTAWIRALRASL